MTSRADDLLARMRADTESEWPDRLLNDMARPTYYRQRTEALILTAAESKVLTCASQGMDRQMIADTLGVTLETVKTQLVTARRVLKAKNTAHAVAIALRQGLIK